MQNAILYQGSFWVVGPRFGSSGAFRITPSYRGADSVNVGVASVQVRHVGVAQLARIAAEECRGDVDPVPMLVSGVFRYGNHWHALLASLGGMWALLAHHNSLNPKPTVVLTNSLRTNASTPYKRHQCCVSESNHLEADVGPWQPAFAALARDSLRTHAWLRHKAHLDADEGQRRSDAHPQSGRAPSRARCLGRALFGVSTAANFYQTPWWSHSEPKLPTAHASHMLEKREVLLQFIQWLEQALGLPTLQPSQGVPTSRSGRKRQAGPLRLLMVSRRRAGRRQVANMRQLAEAARAIPGLEVSEVDFHGMSLAEQILLVRAHHLYASIHGASMLNAMFMNPESSVAIMIKTCGCSLRDNYWNLLRHGSPGRIVQWVAHREGADNETTDTNVDEPTEAMVAQSGKSPCPRCSITRNAHVPPQCWSDLVQQAMQMIRPSTGGQIGAGYARVDPDTGLLTSSKHC
mmetsp:Transcript_30548/g.57555  ORF Transcript_30548/g.57555 Transcript_30548/m.57555 type:complete len:462 (+) Transcript_30548:828-2213(+)